MHLSSSGALLSGAASIRLYQLVASVLTLLFTTSAIVRLRPVCTAEPRQRGSAICHVFTRFSYVPSKLPQNGSL